MTRESVAFVGFNVLINLRQTGGREGIGAREFIRA
jgi:hypothetical protein